MQSLNQFIVERLKLNKDTKIDNRDQWVLIDAPAWSNFDFKTNTQFKELCHYRIFDIQSRDNMFGIWMQMTLVKVSDLEAIKELYGYRNLPRAYKLPENLKINASQKEIQDFIEKHDRVQVTVNDKWNYRNLEKYESQ